MSLTCVKGGRECDGCMGCQVEPEAIGKCDQCHDDIHEDDDRYEMPDGAIIHEDCLREWAEKYRVNV